MSPRWHMAKCHHLGHQDARLGASLQSKVLRISVKQRRTLLYKGDIRVPSRAQSEVLRISAKQRRTLLCRCWSSVKASHVQCQLRCTWPVEVLMISLCRAGQDISKHYCMTRWSTAQAFHVQCQHRCRWLRV